MSYLGIFIQGNLDLISLGSSADETDYIIGEKVSGLSFPSVSVRMDEGAADGGYYISSRRLPRDIDLPITVIGTDRADVETKLRRLMKALNNKGNAARLIIAEGATSADEWYIDGYYMSGANVVYGESAGKQFANLFISLRCPNPYWTRNVVETVTLNKTAVDSGTVYLTNNGDIETSPIYTLNGPMQNVSLTLNGQSWAYIPSILAGASVVINTDTKTVVDGTTGANKYSGMGDTPNLFPLETGENVIDITTTSFGLVATIVVTWSDKKEVLF